MKTIMRYLSSILFFIVPIVANADDSMLRVKCSGDDVGGAVSINGKFKGECPVDIPLQPGTYKLRVEKNDATYDRSFEQDIRMGEGTVKKVEVELSKQLTAAGQKVEEARVRQEAELEKIHALEAAKAKINTIERLGIVVTELSEEAKAKLQVPGGLLIKEVMGVIAKDQLVRDDVILAFGNIPVETVPQFKELLDKTRKGAHVALLTRRGEGVVYIVIRLDE